MTTTPFQDSATQLIERYKSLLDHVEKRFFEMEKAKVIEWPDLEHRPKWKAILIMLCFPYFLLSGIKQPAWLFQSIAIGIWFVCSAFWANLSDTLLKYLTETSVFLGGTSQMASSHLSFVNIIGIVTLLFIPVSYGQVIWFLFNRKNPRRSRLIWLCGLIGLAGVIFFYTQADYSANVPAALQAALLFKMIGIFIVSLLPALIFPYSIFMLLVFNGMTLALGLLNVLVRFSRPIALDILEKLIFEPVKMGKTQWCFRDLNLQEIHSMREWAEQNLEINEKKNIPVAIMLAVAGLLASTSPAQKFLNDLIQDRAKDVIRFLAPPTPFSITDYFSIMPTAMATMTIIVFLLTIWTVHLQNFTIQGAVVQLCIVAEYAKEREEAQAQQKIERSSMLQSFFDWLMKWL
jgi:hypothetical protein